MINKVFFIKLDWGSKDIYLLVNGFKNNAGSLQITTQHPLPKQSQLIAKQLINYFISFILNLSNFLLGYLFRPYHTQNHSYLSLIFMMAIVATLKPQLLIRSTVLVNAGLFVVMVVAHLSDK